MDGDSSSKLALFHLYHPSSVLVQGTPTAGGQEVWYQEGGVYVCVFVCVCAYGKVRALVCAYV
jgi:hypothetical protein